MLNRSNSMEILLQFQVALSYKNQILGYIDSYIARTRYLVSGLMSKINRYVHIKNHR